MFSLPIIKNPLIKIALCSIIIFLSSCSTEVDDPIIELDEVAYTDLKYGEEKNQTYDLYLPEGRDATSTKLLILVHGGSWISGDKSDMTPFISLLKLRLPSYAIANINYRLAVPGESIPFPMQTDDLSTVINKITEEAEANNHTTEFAFIGASAGAHLSMLYAYKYDTKKQIKMVGNIVGPTNFLGDGYQTDEYKLVKNEFLALMNIPETDSDYYNSISPYHVVSSSAPPTIMFYGGKDPLIPSTQGIKMKEKLDNLGVTNEYYFYENEGHGWLGASLVDSSSKLELFIKEHY